MWFLPMFYPDLCRHELGYNWVLLKLWLQFKKQHYICSQMFLLSIPKLLTLKRKPPASIKQECHVPMNYKRKQ